MMNGQAVDLQETQLDAWKKDREESGRHPSKEEKLMETQWFELQ